MKRKENIIEWVIKQSWFFSGFLFLGLIIFGNIDSKKDFFATLILCLLLWLLDILFLKEGINSLLYKVLNLYKKWAKNGDKKNEMLPK